MKNYLNGFYFSLPVQLFLLHFRRYQVLLLFWYIHFSVVNGSLLKTYGAFSLYLAPEYLDKVNAISAAMVGVSIGIFIMSWNITTFILHGKHLRFLATTSNPFLKYCLNNAIIPIIFLVFYMYKAIRFNRFEQLATVGDVAWLIGGFAVGLFTAIFLAFAYFFGADTRIYKGVASVIDKAGKTADAAGFKSLSAGKRDIRVDWFFASFRKLRKPRDTHHYSEEFLDSIFKRHHIAAVISIAFAVCFLLAMGFFLDDPVFQIPAGASSTLFFSILIAVAGAFTLFFKNWSIIMLVLLYLGLNFFVQNDFIDVRNKAYGINYDDTSLRPAYSKEAIETMASDENMDKDKRTFLQILHNWKQKQEEEKPVMYLLNVSGGGNRSATFTMKVLQHLDSITDGKLMDRTFLISGASGGMLGAAYFREMTYQRQLGNLNNVQDQQYVDNISKDLLNPLFSSFVARDITSPAQRFDFNNYSYIKDRGYSFERKLNENTDNFLNKQLKDYVQPERNAEIPIMLFNSVITMDGRKMMISSNAARFMMKPKGIADKGIAADADVIDFVSMFKDLDPDGLSVLSALRMNATFPYVLPNVWLPTQPVIDVMDAGLRDNFGTEASMRFIAVFDKWLKENTSKVVIIEIRDRRKGDWQPDDEPDVLSWLTEPATVMQHNWFRIQDYYHADQLSYVSTNSLAKIEQVVFQYVPVKKDKFASLSFHLTKAEKNDIQSAIHDPGNQESFRKLLELSPNSFRLQKFEALR